MLLDTRNDADLLFGSNQYLAAFLGVTQKTIENYKSGKTKLPETARRLLKLRYGDLTGLLGQEWQGFCFANGELFTPEFKYGFKPEEMRAWFFGRQELAFLRRENVKLQQEIKKMRSDLWAREKVRLAFRPTRKLSPATSCAKQPARPPAPPASSR